MPFGEIEQEPGQPLSAISDHVLPEQGIGLAPAPCHNVTVGTTGARMRIEEGAELSVPHDQRANSDKGLDRGIPLARGFAGRFPDDIAASAQRYDGFLAVLGHPQNLHPAVKDYENVRCRVSRTAKYRARLVIPAMSQ
jgi:hypothetical protein